MSNIILTTSGASFMNQAGASGPYIPIKYFLPVYDHRYDALVHPTSALIPVSAGDFTSAVNPFGDIIYNIDSLSTSAYSMTPTEFLVYDPNQTGTSTISNSTFDSTANITLRSGRPLSHSISATSFVYSYPNWTVDGYTIVSGDSSVPTGYATTTDKFFNTVSYSPISSAAGGNARGLFKIRLGNQVGNFKFNKIALYAAKILANGSEDTSVTPVLFGIAMLREPIIKSNDGYNISFFELDVELQFSSNGYFSQTSFINNTEWTVAGDNLWWDRRVIIGTSGVPGSYTARAKLHIVENNTNAPMIRLTTDNDDAYVDTFMEEFAATNQIEHISSKDGMLCYYLTSGISNNLNYSQYELLLNNSGTRHIMLGYVTSAGVDKQTQWLVTNNGTYEYSSIYVDSNPLSTFKSINGSYGTLVLGYDSISKFEHASKFLTVHGGSLFVGANLMSGANDISTPTLSANGYITAANIYSKGLLISDGNINNSGDLNSTVGVNYFSTMRLSTSAHFSGNMTYTGYVSGNNSMYSRYNYVNRDLWVGGSITTDTGIVAYGLNQVSVFDYLRSATSADFQGPVRMNQRLTTVDSISAGKSVSAYGGFYELDRGFPNGRWQDGGTPTLTSNVGTITQNSTVFRYMVVGKTLFLKFFFDLTASNGAAIDLHIALPNGYLTAYGPNMGHALFYTSPTTESAFVYYASAGDNRVTFHRMNYAAFGTASFQAFGVVVVEIQ